MIVLDTNVVSELVRPAPAGAVVDWFGAHDPAELYLTAVGEAELRVGVAALPAGRRRELLRQALQLVIEVDFAGRILPFDSAAAAAYADIYTARRRAGRPIATLDCQIAAIASVRGARLATRNVADFVATGVALVDPWSAGASG